MQKDLVLIETVHVKKNTRTCESHGRELQRMLFHDFIVHDSLPGVGNLVARFTNAEHTSRFKEKYKQPL